MMAEEVIYTGESRFHTTELNALLPTVEKLSGVPWWAILCLISGRDTQGLAAASVITSHSESRRLKSENIRVGLRST